MMQSSSTAASAAATRAQAPHFIRRHRAASLARLDVALLASCAFASWACGADAAPAPAGDVPAAGTGASAAPAAPMAPAVSPNPASAMAGPSISGAAGTEGVSDATLEPPTPPGVKMPTSEELPTPPTLGWVGAWATGPQLTEPQNLPPAPGLANGSLRQNVFPTLSGGRVRVLLSNEFGEAPVEFESVRLARSAGGVAIDVASDRALRFAGSEAVTIAAGQAQFSDPIEFDLTALSSVAVSLRFGSAPSNVTGHPGSRTTSFLVAGDSVADASFGGATTDHWYFITGIDVEAPAPSAAVVTLGDSITDGRGSTTNANDRWPDNLARRLQADASTADIAVLNQGIGGNAVVAGGLGPTAIQRFERDVLEQRGARWVILLEGVNDIGGSSDAGVADRLIQAYEGFIDAAHERGLLIYGVPILPFGGSSYDSPQHEAARQAVNRWVRDSGRFDEVIDLDTAVADPAAPTRLLPAYDSGDGLHLNPAGYRAMADAIDLSLFAR
jgi:lysophospholipase L1-like esterase